MMRILLARVAEFFETAFGSRKTLNILAVVMLSLAIPLTIYVAGQQQDIRQRASGAPGCAGSDGAVRAGGVLTGTTCQGWVASNFACEGNLENPYYYTSCSQTPTATPIPIPTSTPAPTPVCVPGAVYLPEHPCSGWVDVPTPTPRPAVCQHRWCLGSCESGNNAEKAYYYTASQSYGSSCGKYYTASCLPICGSSPTPTPTIDIDHGVCQHRWCLGSCESGKNAEKYYYYPSSGAYGMTCGKYYTASCLPICSAVVTATSVPGATNTPTSTGAAGDPTSTATSVPVATNTSVPGATNTPTSTGAAGDPTSTGAPTATSVPGSTQLALTLNLSGIFASKTIRTPQRNILVEFYNASAVLVGSGITQPTALAYNSGNGKFTGTISLPNIPAGSYNVKVKTDRYLKKILPGIVTITSTTQLITIPEITLAVGDINGDNINDVRDYNLLVSCFATKATSAACGDNRINADLDDDGDINEVDYNILIRSFSNRSGD